MSPNETLIRLNEAPPPFVELLHGHISHIDVDQQSCTFEFCPPLLACHSVNIVQRGFITIMLDAAMSHAVFAHCEDVIALSSYEITTRFESVTRGGETVRAIGTICKASFRTAFLEAKLLNHHDTVTATAQSVAKLTRRKSGS